MPQLDASTFTAQLFWLVVWFGLLYLLMVKIGLPRIAVAIEARRERREDDLARARRLKSEAEEVSADFQRAMSDARAQAQAVIKEASDRDGGAPDRRQQGRGLDRSARRRDRCRPLGRRKADRVAARCRKNDRGRR